MIMALSLKNLVGNVINKFSSFLTLNKEWKDNEYFDESWKDRIAFMAKFINPKTLVMDLGCGKMWLKNYLPVDCKYIPVDYCSRSHDTIIADFNKREFPTISSNTIFISGCLEYIISPDWFLEQISKKATHRVIMSYCTLEIFNDLKQRKKKMWKNNLTSDFIESIFLSHSFTLTHKSIFNQNTIFVFDRI